MSNQVHAVRSISAGIAELTVAHGEVIAIIRMIPDMALDWQTSSGGCSHHELQEQKHIP